METLKEVIEKLDVVTRFVFDRLEQIGNCRERSNLECIYKDNLAILESLRDIKIKSDKVFYSLCEDDIEAVWDNKYPQKTENNFIEWSGLSCEVRDKIKYQVQKACESGIDWHDIIDTGISEVDGLKNIVTNKPTKQ